MSSYTHAHFATFFALVRAGLYGTPLAEHELPKHIDWEAIIFLARKHAILGVVIESLQYLPPHLQPSREMVAAMRKFGLKLIQSNTRLDRAVGQLVTFFEKNGINGLLLKGQGVARMYRSPLMRQPGDIDFYVGEAQYREAVRLCHKHLVDDPATCQESRHDMSFKHDGVIVELHRLAIEVYSPFHRRDFQRCIVTQLEHSPQRRRESIGGVEVVVPSPGFNALYIFYHALHHFITGGIGLRQLCDWAMVFHAHGDELDREQLTRDIRRFGLTRPWKYFACIAVEYLGVPAEQMPLYDTHFSKRAKRLLEVIVVGGNFGEYYRRHFNQAGLEGGVGYALSKFRYISRNLVATLPVMPSEALFFYLYRLQTALKVLTHVKH